jgi:sarcosine oxidase
VLAVHAAGRSWTASTVVVAAGAWVGDITRGLVTLPSLEITCEQPAHFRPVVEQASWPSFIHHVRRSNGPDQPLGVDGYGLLTPGEGVKVAEHGSGVIVPDADHRPFEPDPDRLERLCRYVRAWFPGLDPDPVSATTCLYTSTPDHHFVLDRVGPIVVCSPCSGHGFKFVPLIGALTADLACGGEQRDPAWRFPAQ